MTVVYLKFLFNFIDNCHYFHYFFDIICDVEFRGNYNVKGGWYFGK